MDLEPVNLVALAAVVMGCLAVIIPVAGFTARFAIKPIAEALSKARESGSSRDSLALLERRTALLEQEVQSLAGMRSRVEQLTEEVEFHRQLAAGSARDIQKT